MLTRVSGRGAQVFGKETTTQELAQPPTHCAGAKAAQGAYTIKRVRYDRVTVVYTPVNTTDITWPLRTMMPMIAMTRTFNDTVAFCIQHIIEVLDHPNPCVNLAPDGGYRHARARVEL